MKKKTVKQHTVKQHTVKQHTGGKSILHVRNTSGGFVKVHKTGRLGKNCIHFNLEKKTCDLYGEWCDNSSICSGYKRKKQALNN